MATQDEGDRILTSPGTADSDLHSDEPNWRPEPDALWSDPLRLSMPFTENYLILIPIDRPPHAPRAPDSSQLSRMDTPNS